MKVMSYNARGLGGGEKRVEVHRLVQEKYPLVLCIQESKLSKVDDFLIKEIWGDVPCCYSYQPSVGAFVGLVNVWDISLIEVWSSMSFGHVLIINGRVILTSEEVVIFNVYASCELVDKRNLWDKLTSLVIAKNDTCLCVCGDFNSIQNSDERKGRGTMFRQADEEMFNKFIEDKLDQFLLSEKLCEVWPN